MYETRIIRTPELLEITGLSRTTIWRMEKKNTFPPRVQLGPHSVGWFYDEVMCWIASRPIADASNDNE